MWGIFMLQTASAKHIRIRKKRIETNLIIKVHPGMTGLPVPGFKEIQNKGSGFSSFI
jgi:hypothetical protein